MTRKGPDDSHLIHRELTGATIGAFFEVYNWLDGGGYLESLLFHFGPEPRFLRCVNQKFLD